MNRRAFLARLGFGTIGAAAAALTFDVEKLLWVAGEKTIFLPPAQTLVTVTAAEAQRIYNFYMTTAVEFAGLPPKAPWFVEVQWSKA